MSFKNFLDLRKKVSPQIKVVERVILQKRSLKSDLFLTFAVIFVASGVIWGITKADTFIAEITEEKASESFSAVGIISDITNSTISLSDANTTKDENNASYTFSITNIKKIETEDYSVLTLSDLKVGDKVILQGEDFDGQIKISRIISFGNIPVPPTATSTDPTATSTLAEQTGEAPSSTEKATSTSFIEIIKDVVEDVIDKIMGTSTDTDTGTSTDENTDESTGTSSDEIIPDPIIENIPPSEEASSSDEIVPEPEIETPPASPPQEEIIEPDPIEEIVETPTPSSSSEDPVL